MHINNPSHSSLYLTVSLHFGDYNLASSRHSVCISTTPLLPPSLTRYHPGHWCVAKWSRSSCTTEATAGTATTASPAPAVTRSCWMEPASSWTSTPLRTTTCWMGTQPPQVGSTEYLQIPHQTICLVPNLAPLSFPSMTQA